MGYGDSAVVRERTVCHESGDGTTKSCTSAISGMELGFLVAKISLTLVSLALCLGVSIE